MVSRSSRRLPRCSPVSTNKCSYSTPPNHVSSPSNSRQPIVGRSQDASMQKTPEECAAKLLEYTKIILECRAYLRMLPQEHAEICQEMEVKHPPNPTIFDRPKEILDRMQTRYDSLLAQTGTPNSVRGYFMRMTYAHTAMKLYLSVQVFPRSTRDPEFFNHWDAAYTRGNGASMATGVSAPGSYTAPVSKILAPQFAVNATRKPSRSKRADTGVRHSRILEEAKDLLKDTGVLLSKRLRYHIEKETVDWRVICVQQMAGNQFQYVVKFTDDEVVFDKEFVIDLIIDSSDA